MGVGVRCSAFAEDCHSVSGGVAAQILGVLTAACHRIAAVLEVVGGLVAD